MSPNRDRGLAPVALPELARKVHTHRVQDSRRALLVITTSLAVLAVASCSAGNSHTASSPVTTAAEVLANAAGHFAATASKSSPLQTTAIVKGRPGGGPPCAPGLEGEYGADISHPERAPIQEAAEFAHGVRWAICGADTAMTGELLNLRSADNGDTWRVTDTGIGMSPHHAGDSITIRLVSAESGRMRLRSRVGDFDDTYVTTDGGLTWRQTASSDFSGAPR